MNLNNVGIVARVVLAVLTVAALVFVSVSLLGDCGEQPATSVETVDASVDADNSLTESDASVNDAAAGD